MDACKASLSVLLEIFRSIFRYHLVHIVTLWWQIVHQKPWVLQNFVEFHRSLSLGFLSGYVHLRVLIFSQSFFGVLIFCKAKKPIISNFWIFQDKIQTSFEQGRNWVQVETYLFRIPPPYNMPLCCTHLYIEIIISFTCTVNHLRKYRQHRLDIEECHLWPNKGHRQQKQKNCSYTKQGRQHPYAPVPL